MDQDETLHRLCLLILPYHSTHILSNVAHLALPLKPRSRPSFMPVVGRHRPVVLDTCVGTVGDSVVTGGTLIKFQSDMVVIISVDDDVATSGSLPLVVGDGVGTIGDASVGLAVDMLVDGTLTMALVTAADDDVEELEIPTVSDGPAIIAGETEPEQSSTDCRE